MLSHIPSLFWAMPLVRDWFNAKFGSPTEPQVQGWPAILAGKDTLISAPTGSGKTFAAFLVCIEQLVRQSQDGTLSDQTTVLYVSPLKALSNDIHKNLTEPLREITDLARERGLTMTPINVAVRTGDTLARERQAMLKKPPHILVTTPESLYILLTAGKSREILKTIKTVIVDEIHALVNNKRGAHLALSLERLAALTQQPFTRIGLSATQKPLKDVADFLVGTAFVGADPCVRPAASTEKSGAPAKAIRPQPEIISIGHQRQLDLAIEVPASELSSIASNEMWDEIYNRLAELTQQNRSTLIFVNTRKLAERVAHHLAERLGKDQVAAHHGSLSRKLRLDVEEKLKRGALKALVATASLELGIDIGAIDLVCQMGSPRAIATALQRVGRAGHWHGAISKGRFFVTTRDELIECAALVYAIRQGDLDQLIMPPEPLDILSQQMVAACVTEEWQEDDLFALVKRAKPYENLSRDVFDSLLIMLSEGIAGSRGRYGTYLFRDQVNHRIKARRGARLTAIMSGGAIPDNALYTVIVEPTHVMVGTLDEDFAIESNRGDIILLGTTSWKIKRIESALGRVLVEDAKGAPPTVPFWLGEAPARSKELSLYVSELREKVDDFFVKSLSALDWLKENCRLDQAGAEQIIEYLQQGKALLGAIPTQKVIIAERFFDESGGMQLVMHAPFGARINKAWGLALRKRFCRSFNFELQAAATDNGLTISLAEQHSFPLADVFHFLHPNTLRETLVQAVLQSPLFKTRWRWVATRSLALARFRGGRKIPPSILRMLSDDLLAAVFPNAAACQDNLAGEDIELPDHPLVFEAMRDVLIEALDIEGTENLIAAIVKNEIQCLAVDTPAPSVFSHELLNANPYAFLDDAPLEERRTRAVEMRRVLPASVLQETGKLDLSVILEVQEQAWPDVRNADELHDFLQTIIIFPCEKAIPQWENYFSELIAERRAGTALIENKRVWLAAEKNKLFSIIYPHATFEQSFVDISQPFSTRDAAILTLLRGWLLHLGPTTEQELSDIVSINETDMTTALIQLENTGFILRGHFRRMEQIEWCERRLLARIHHLTLGKLRKEIEPVTPAQFFHWLMSWQHLVPGTKVRDEHGLLEIIKQLQGFEIPANAWEKQIFAPRMKNYDSDWLERLCLRGIVGWGRLSSPFLADESAKKRILPTSVAPITFFVREESDWLPSHPLTDKNHLAMLSHVAQLIYEYLQHKGASFFVDIVRGINRLKSEVEMGLWELVTAGLITADGFDNLRSLIDPKRRLGRTGRRRSIKSYSTGRWALLYSDAEIKPTKQIESACWMLLTRYGVVFRDLLTRERNIPRWRELLLAFRRLEERGEVRGGRFVSGFLGEQFALPYAVDGLRAMRRKGFVTEAVTMAAVDPLNLVGIILPGERVPAISGKQIETADFLSSPNAFIGDLFTDEKIPNKRIGG